MTKEDIHLEIKEGVMALSGEKQTEKKEEGDKWHRVERHYGKFTRQIRLPPGTDPSRITAAFNNGVLEVRVLKPAEAQIKKIDIQ